MHHEQKYNHSKHLSTLYAGAKFAFELPPSLSHGLLNLTVKYFLIIKFNKLI